MNPKSVSKLWNLLPRRQKIEPIAVIFSESGAKEKRGETGTHIRGHLAHQVCLGLNIQTRERFSCCDIFWCQKWKNGSLNIRQRTRYSEEEIKEWYKWVAFAIKVKNKTWKRLSMHCCVAIYAYLHGIAGVSSRIAQQGSYTRRRS